MATLLCLLLPVDAQASVPGVETLDLPQAPVGLATIAIFVLACLLSAMTCVNAMHERLVLESLRAELVHRGFGYRHLVWMTGILAFLLSRLPENLTMARVKCAVPLAVGKDSKRFVGIGCVIVVVAANAGGSSQAAALLVIFLINMVFLVYWTLEILGITY